MRTLLLALVAALVLAGCAHPAPAALSPASVTPDSPGATAAPAPTPPPSSAPASSPSPSASAPTPAANATAAPAPAVAAWNLTAAGPLGWLAGVGDPGLGDVNPALAPADPGEQGKSDAQHCPDATLVLPVGATKLVVKLSGDPAGPNGVGLLALNITPPKAPSDDLVPDPTTMSAGAPVVLSKSYALPANGTWTFHVMPLPGSVAQTWTLGVAASGASATPPAPLTLALAKACTS